MNSRERLLAALNHREPDRVPLDLGSTPATGIHVVAWRNLRACLGLTTIEPSLYDHVLQLARPDDDLVERLGIDVRGLFPLNSHNWRIVKADMGDTWEYVDEWGIAHHRNKPDGLSYRVGRHPLTQGNLTVPIVQAYPWPKVADPLRITGLREAALAIRAQGKAVVIQGVLGGLVEMAAQLRGPDGFRSDLASNEAVVCALFDKILELKLAFWEMALPPLADVIDVVFESEDYGPATLPLISPRLFRRLAKPRMVLLFGRLRHLAPRAKAFFHAGGNSRPLLPDFVQLGIDIVNPPSPGAFGIEPDALKREFGRDLVFWGGGVHERGLLATGSPAQVQQAVRDHLQFLAPGGGVVFAPAGNIPADAAPQNLVALFQALAEYGRY